MDNKQLYKNINFTDLGKALRRNGCMDWLPYDPVELENRFIWLAAFGKLLVPEYHFKRAQMDWWSKPLFINFIEEYNDHAHGFDNDRKWNLSQLLRLCAHVPGDTAECGVYKGASSWFILNCWREFYNNGSRKHHLFDSFEGLSEPGPFDGTHWYKHTLSASVKEAMEKLERFSSAIVIHKGWIPEKFFEIETSNFAFVHIDVDIYEPTKASIEFFYPRLNNGGILICDDYGFSTCPGATLAIDEFLKDKPERMISFASGGGWFMKGVETQAQY